MSTTLRTLYLGFSFFFAAISTNQFIASDHAVFGYVFGSSLTFLLAWAGAGIMLDKDGGR